MAKQSRRRRNSQTRSAQNSTPKRQAARAAAAVRQAALNPFEPMGRMMQAFMPFAWAAPWAPMAAPDRPTVKVDVIDRNEQVLVRAEVPGVTKGHLEVEASDLAVTIKGEMSHDETREDEDRYRIHETSYGLFERTVRMPSDVDSARAKASFKDGVLEVMLPKVDRARPHNVKF